MKSTSLYLPEQWDTLEGIVPYGWSEYLKHANLQLTAVEHEDGYYVVQGIDVPTSSLDDPFTDIRCVSCHTSESLQLIRGVDASVVVGANRFDTAVGDVNAVNVVNEPDFWSEEYHDGNDGAMCSVCLDQALKKLVTWFNLTTEWLKKNHVKNTYRLTLTYSAEVEVDFTAYDHEAQEVSEEIVDAIYIPEAMIGHHDRIVAHTEDVYPPDINYDYDQI